MNVTYWCQYKILVAGCR